MNTPPRFTIHVSDDAREPVDATDDYDEAVAQCRLLVEEDGFAYVEVRRGDQVCCIAYWDAAGRSRLLDHGDGDDAAALTSTRVEASPPNGSDRPRLPSARGEADVTQCLHVPGRGDAPADDDRATPSRLADDGGALADTPASAKRHHAERGTSEHSALVFGADLTGRPTRWLGL